MESTGNHTMEDTVNGKVTLMTMKMFGPVKMMFLIPIGTTGGITVNYTVKTGTVPMIMGKIPAMKILQATPIINMVMPMATMMTTM